MRHLVATSCVLATLGVAPAAGQAPGTPEILILGTYHMANPGRDVHNVEADDVLSDRRQREIAEVIAVLKRFGPTKVAVESPAHRNYAAEQYAQYLAGDLELTRNETHQIGFRLAKELGHPTVYPIDADGEFPYYRVLNYAKANGLEARFDSIRRTGAESAATRGEFLRTHTVLEVLGHMNADSSAAAGVAGYYGFVPFGDPLDYAGPELLARWFERNIRIYRNIHALAASPDDRVLVIIGAGHLGWLQRMAADDPSVRLRKLDDLVTAPGR